MCLRLRILEGEVESNACSGGDIKALEADQRCVFFLTMNHVTIVCKFFDRHILLIAELAKAGHLKNELVKCKSEYANLEAMDAEAERLHTKTLLAMEAEYVSRVSSLEGELQSVVAVGRAAY